MERKGECLLSLKKYKEARNTFQEAIASLKFAKIDKNKKDKFLTVTRENIAKTEKGEQEEDEVVKVTQTTQEKVIQ